MRFRLTERPITFDVKQPQTVTIVATGIFITPALFTREEIFQDHMCSLMDTLNASRMGKIECDFAIENIDRVIEKGAASGTSEIEFSITIKFSSDDTDLLNPGDIRHIKNYAVKVGDTYVIGNNASINMLFEGTAPDESLFIEYLNWLWDQLHWFQQDYSVNNKSTKNHVKAFHIDKLVFEL